MSCGAGLSEARTRADKCDIFGRALQDGHNPDVSARRRCVMLGGTRMRAGSTQRTDGRAGAATAGAREALGAAAVAMGTTFLAFGAAVREAGLGLAWAMAASWLVYGMAGQIVLLQFAVPSGAAAVGAGGAVLPATLGATAANARFFPMAVAIAPWLGGPGWRRWLALPFIAITPWAAAMRRLPSLPAAARLPWFLGFGVASWTAAGAATAAGYLLAPRLDPGLRAALLFANPLYFALLMAADLRSGAGTRLPGLRRGPLHRFLFGHPPRLAILSGAVVAPLALLLPSAWGLLTAGVLGGTAAFLVGRGR
jgi:predicted branched-subunit amino acid permease